MCWVGAPIRNHNGEAIAALSVGLPGERYALREREVREAVALAGEHTSALIGFNPLLTGEGRWVWTSEAGREELRPLPRRRARSRPPKEDPA